MITHEVTLMLSHKGHKKKAVFEVCDLGKSTVIIGYTWLQKHNPEIDWKTGDIKFTKCPRECNVTTKKCKQKKALAFKYKASVEEIDEVIEEEENVCEDDKDTEDDIYLQVLKYIQEVEMKIEKKTDEEMVLPQFHAYLDVFKRAPSEHMPVCKPWDHVIDLYPNFIPQKSKLYPISPTEQQEVRNFIDDQLKKGYIRSTKSPQTSLVFFISKKDGKKQIVQDYWYLNKGTIKNNYLLPLIPELIDRIGDAKVFMKLDLRWGYNNVHIKKGDKWKTVFTCQDGTFEHLVMFFGLCNLPGTFQTMMNEIFHDMAVVVMVYIDDILIFTKTEEGHNEIVQEVLCRLRANDLFLKPEKCFFKQQEIEFLGLIIGPNGVEMDPSKIEGITNWPMPTKVKEVQSFLELANFYHQFIKDFSKVVILLHKLTRKDQKWEYDAVHQKAFDELKAQFTKKPILMMVDITKELHIELDASNFATGAVLSMKCDDGKWLPCAYLSKGLNDVK